MKQPLNEQFRRMQKLAGIITENEYKQPIKENKIGNIDIDLAKKIQDTPEIKKLANALKSNKTLMDNALKFVAKVAKNNVNEVVGDNWNTSKPEYEVLRIKKLAYDLLQNEMSADEMENLTYSDAALKLIDFIIPAEEVDMPKYEKMSPNEFYKTLEMYMNKAKMNAAKKREEDSKMDIGDKIKAILISSGLGVLYGAMTATMYGGSVPYGYLGPIPQATPEQMAASIIVGALFSLGIGAAATTGFTKKPNLEESEEEDQIKNIIDMGNELNTK